MECIFVSDLHGRRERYEKLFAYLNKQPPDAVFLGGDLLPGGLASTAATGSHESGFVNGYLKPNVEKLRSKVGRESPRIFLILGNDDGRFEESAVRDGDSEDLWDYVHERRIYWAGYDIYGYNYIPPTPFQLKDWERYDVSRYVDPGAVSPEEGYRSSDVSIRVARYSTIAEDLEALTDGEDLSRAIMLFHAPPYKTSLDRADLDDRMIDYVPADVHVGSIAVRRLIEARSPLLTLHGHVHESARITGTWRQRLGSTWCFNSAHDGRELAMIVFDPEHLEDAERRLL